MNTDIKKTTTGHLCCGAGGDILASKLSGCSPLWGIDIDDAAVKTARLNHNDVKILQVDIKNMCDVETVDILICGIPCQPFTRIGRQLKEKDKRDISLYVATTIKKIQPRYLIFENVREYKSSMGFEILNNELSDYKIHWDTINVADYGIPQRRKRLFGLGSLDKNITFPKPTHCNPVHAGLFQQLSPWVTFQSIKNGDGMPPMSAKAIKGIWRRQQKHISKGNGFSIQIIEDDDMCPTVLGQMYRGSGTGSNSIMIYDRGYLRNISFLEIRRAQGFPEYYIFFGKAKERWLLVGNAFPPLMARKLIEAIINDNR